MASALQAALISEEEYLAGEEASDIKHEYIDGYVYAMSGASINHSTIAGNIYSEIRAFLKGKQRWPRLFGQSNPSYKWKTACVLSRYG